jgi:hypothetical protein
VTQLCLGLKTVFCITAFQSSIALPTTQTHVFEWHPAIRQPPMALMSSETLN